MVDILAICWFKCTTFCELLKYLAQPDFSTLKVIFKFYFWISPIVKIACVRLRTPFCMLDVKICMTMTYMSNNNNGNDICAMVHANRNVCGVYPSIWGGKRAENTPSFSLPLFSFWEEKNRRKSCCFRLMLNYIWSNQAYIFQWWNKIVHRVAHKLHSFTCVYRNGNYHWRWSHFFYIF